MDAEGPLPIFDPRVWVEAFNQVPPDLRIGVMILAALFIIAWAVRAFARRRSKPD